ncbi:MAG: tyrosine-type recombinase/integrase [Clostridia bacterium]|nr:tyrosine-type recombinase/integrase [Clostridia bacterium]MBR6028384.1 tyrosine-type recombinase/integrase [Clostridia bacterium]
MLIRDAITEFHFDCQVRKLSPKTIALYDRQLEYIAAYMEQTTGLTNIEDVRSIHIKKFLVTKGEAGRKPQYINDLLKAFKVFFKYCYQEGHIQTDPCAKVQNVKQPKLKLRTFNEEEIRKMLNYYNGRRFTDIRNKTMLAMFFDTGMRLNEVLTLKQEQIHDEYILVHGKGNKERLVPVSPFLAKLLLKYRIAKDSYFNVNTIPQNYVFVSYRGTQLNQQAVSNMMKAAAEAVGVRKEVRVSPHTCRHTFAHIQLKNGLDLYSLSRLMGHENISITQRYLDGIKDDEVLIAAKQTGVLAHL